MTKKNKLGLAVAAALSIGAMVPTAEAVNIAANGVGELVYVPYYSTTGGKLSVVRLTNNSFDTLAVKLKVRDGTSSQDVRDFHLFLSPRDVWLGWVNVDANGVVTLSTADTSCTAPSKASWNSAGGGIFSIDIPAPIGGSNSNSTEGYIAAIVMGTADGREPTQGDTSYNAVAMMQHGDNNVPEDCAGVSSAFDLSTADNSLVNPEKFISLRSQFTEATNALSAAAAVVTPEGKIIDMPVTVLANAGNPGPNGMDGESGYEDSSITEVTENDTIQLASDEIPDERFDIWPKSADIYNYKDVSVTNVDLSGGETNPVSAALMTSSLSNYIDTTGGNSWVVTFPTKKIHFGTPCSAPFPLDCQADVTPMVHSVIDEGAVTYITNEEESFEEIAPIPPQSQICFSGQHFIIDCPIDQKPPEEVIQLQTEVNVVTMGGGNPLGSALTTNIPLPLFGIAKPIKYGWMQMRFSDAQEVVVGDTTLYGLPAIGFSLTDYGFATMTQPFTFTTPLSK